MAKASAMAAGARGNPSAPKPRLRAASSTFAGTTRKDTPAASSSLRREGLAEASRSSTGAASAMVRLNPLSGIGPLVPIMQKANDGGSRLLHGPTRHVYHRPAVPGAQSPRVLDLVGNLRAIDIVGKIAIPDEMHPVAPDLGDTL